MSGSACRTQSRRRKAGPPSAAPGGLTRLASALGTIGRLVYPDYEELTALAAAAAATSPIRLTTVLLGRLHTNTAVSPEMVKGYAGAFAEVGCDELIFVPTSSRLDQVGLLAEAVS
jgi:hypothetical protein